MCAIDALSVVANAAERTREMKKKHLLIAGDVLFALVALSLCDRDGPAPVIVAQPSAPGGGHYYDNSGVFSDLLMGHLMSGGGYGHSSNINITHHTTVIKNYHPAPRYNATSDQTLLWLRLVRARLNRYVASDALYPSELQPPLMVMPLHRGAVYLP